MKHKHIRFSYTQIIALGFALLILSGTLLLMLPIAAKDGHGAAFQEALFTAASASCVTGLVVQDTFTFWSGFGQGVILTLIQIGGLGVMTIATLFFLLARSKIGLRSREILSESLNSTHVGGILRLTQKILKGTLLFESAGALLLAVRFIPKFGFWEGLWVSVFHSVSAFCNAGFDLMGRYGPYSSFVPYYDDPLVCITLMALIVIGGIGFFVWDDLYQNKLKIKRYSLHTKIVLCSTLILILGSALLFFLTEYNASSAGMCFSQRLLTAFFDSITARTAGFNTVDTAALSDSGKILTIILMFIGGSPGSTAGGIKTTTIFVMLICAFSYITGNKQQSVFGRRLEEGALHKASAVFFTNLMLALTASIVISSLQNIDMLDILFETFSAIGTVGMSTGITRELSGLSRGIIILLMYCGRLGSVSFASALAEKKAPPPIKYPTEEITIG